MNAQDSRMYVWLAIRVGPFGRVRGTACCPLPVPLTCFVCVCVCERVWLSHTHTHTQNRQNRQRGNRRCPFALASLSCFALSLSLSLSHFISFMLCDVGSGPKYSNRDCRPQRHPLHSSTFLLQLLASKGGGYTVMWEHSKLRLRTTCLPP